MNHPGAAAVDMIGMIVGITGVTALEETVVVVAEALIGEMIVEDLIGVTTEVALIAGMTEEVGVSTDEMTEVAMIVAAVAEDTSVVITTTDHGMVVDMIEAMI